MEEIVIVSDSPFDWCGTGDHTNCRRSYKRSHAGPKNTVVYTGEIVKCGCRKRGCKCYIKPADRVKPKKAARRKK